MSREIASHLILLCLLSLGLVTGGMAVFAFANPSAFVEWLSPVHWLKCKMEGSNRKLDNFDAIVSWIFGSLNLFVLSLICFLLGGWFITTFLHLWGSPISRWVLPYP